MRGLSGKTALVTGGAGGIGRAVAARLADEGGRVIVADRDPETARQVAAGLSGPAIAMALDVAERASWEALTENLPPDFRDISILANIAGITRDRSLLRMQDEDWEAVINVNLRGTWLGCQTAFRLFAQQDRGGAIINIASTAIFGTFGQANYSSAKAGITGLTRTAAIEGAKRGIRVNAVAPGVIATPMVMAVPEEIRAKWTGQILAGRFGDPAEIAAVVAFLASDDASYVTGQTLIADGGATTGDF
ncbi:SDR family oxidoreductase [Pseudogemmobacter humi]|uniref:3-oxoacyl-[acyl-carrier-protein] reductase FabG n=1 Tax=Pseudogemmobacter humi TaxID=2483812 RepID=A0A3P5XH63_9RHOB|nr:SDR family oxidoreductase [Pseudogemmobacter humi]VDC28033.1 3-oxoacyl-[acyl-carrier-protein] reductase FabG [Pseudogemmobacter humi]